ncbi:F0F1 ATP synthase subunit epsilon [Saccharospirillum sp. MSK14-1]|uniref:F0F1 ATP synthase subunit epsilon n=1 Tax=Saccharospirillum sp. MSK14-1 TaxID=1897632 RepID=UPI000D3459B4|nr:F0F1 ATP synthase subunit epsilon [Saccharospirillum sp. MSK14-1]PTY37369.1 F0F1 ATP synthase subunit epsilon [Saccharospirillum sp. MSK14-1]
MAMTVHCDIVSAEEKIFEGLVETIVCEGEQGELGIKPKHAPLLTRLNPAPVKLTLQNGSEEVYYVSGGFLEVQPDVVTILADTALRAHDIDEAAAAKAKQDAEQAIADKMAEAEFAQVAADLARAAAQLRTLRESKRLK